MSRNTRSKLMNMILLSYYIQFFYIFDTFLKRQTNLKSMLDALPVKLS
jgi:hypothetical protein